MGGGLIDIYQFNSNLFIHSFQWRVNYNTTHHQSSSTPLTQNRADIQVKSHSNKHTPKGSAICVQRFNDSQTSAVRITYRSSLRSSSIQEPRYPSWRVIITTQNQFNQSTINFHTISYARQQWNCHSNKTHTNDPSAGSPTETLLRLHLPLDDKIYTTSLQPRPREWFKIQSVHRIIQSVGATGGVYKGQGRNQRKLMTCIY